MRMNKVNFGTPLFLLAVGLLFLATAAVAFGQVTQRNILTGRYTADDIRRVLIPRDKWQPYPRTASEWRSRLPSGVVDELIKKGEQYLGKDVPAVSATLFLEYVRNGNRSNYEARSFARRNQLMDLVLAEAVEDKGRFTDTIANYVWAICEETYWGVPAHLSVQKAKNGLPDVDDPIVELFGAETAATLALTDYLVGPKLDKVNPLIRKRIYLEANKKILEPIKHTERYSWLDPSRPVNNWDPWIMSNLITAGLLLEPDESKRAESVYRYMKGIDIYINGLGEDGGCDEGPSYWFAAGASVFDSLDMLRDATGGKIEVYKEPMIGKMASYIYKMYIADNYFVNFADADPTVRSDGIMLYRFGKAVGDERLSQFGIYLHSLNPRTAGEGFMKPRRLSDLLTLKGLPFGTKFEPPTEAWLSDIQVMTAHAANGLFLATHGGHNGESHNHNDVGDLIVYSGNEPVIIDAGRGNYTAKTFSSQRYELWFTQSQYHNLPIVNGYGQLAGKAFAASNIRHTSVGNEVSLSMDISKAYAKEAGIDEWNRIVSMNRVDGTIRVADNYSFKSAPSSLQQVFMTVCDVDISDAGVIKLKTPGGRTVVLKYDKDVWSPAIDTPSAEGPEYSSFAKKWGGRVIQRILLTGRNLKTKGTLIYTIGISKT